MGKRSRLHKLAVISGEEEPFRQVVFRDLTGKDARSILRYVSSLNPLDKFSLKVNGEYMNREQTLDWAIQQLAKVDEDLANKLGISKEDEHDKNPEETPPN